MILSYSRPCGCGYGAPRILAMFEDWGKRPRPSTKRVVVLAALTASMQDVLVLVCSCGNRVKGLSVLSANFAPFVILHP